jgi:two-component system phosphate regulon response regulator OmpR
MTNEKKHILVVDDDHGIRNLLKEYLSKNGFIVAAAKDTAKAREYMKDFTFDLIILDVMMPKETGLEFAKVLKNQNNKTPILMLTALGETADRIKGLELGVDDYLPKPFEPKELLLRIKNILRRTEEGKEKKKDENIIMDNLTYNLKTQTLEDKNKNIIKLTTTDIDLLNLFAKHPNEILSRDEIAKYLNLTDHERSIDVQITRLRKKIETDPKTPKFLRTIRNKGYQLVLS